MFNPTVALSHLKPIHVFVIGDFFLDEYTIGVVNRISPEAPVPVLFVSETKSLPGGAGNVALNLEALGAKVSVFGRVGGDPSGNLLKNLLEEKGIVIDGLLEERGYKTGVKNRFMAGGHQLIRADFETTASLSPETSSKMLSHLKRGIETCDIIALSDYGKGVCTPKLLQEIFSLAKQFSKKVVVDPKGRDFVKYNGAFVIKPNLKEAYEAARLDMHASLDEVAKEIFREVETDYLLVTRSEKGMTLFSRNLIREDFLTEEKNVIDVTGAGDTALSMLTFGLGNHLSFKESIELANVAASIAIKELGCVAVKIGDVAKGLLSKDPQYKIFDDTANNFLLEKVMQDQDVILLYCQKNEEISREMLQLIKEIHFRKKQAKLVMQMPDGEKNKDVVHFLASMQEIDLILITSKKEHAFINSLSILEVVDLKEAIYV